MTRVSRWDPPLPATNSLQALTHFFILQPRWLPPQENNNSAGKHNLKKRRYSNRGVGSLRPAAWATTIEPKAAELEYKYSSIFTQHPQLMTRHEEKEAKNKEQRLRGRVLGQESARKRDSRLKNYSLTLPRRVHRQRKNRPITAAKEIGAESAKLSAEIGVGRDRHRFGNDDRLICLSSADELEKNGRFIGRKAVLEIKVTKRGLEPAYHAVDARVPTTILHAQ
ncbi:hypothetical protein BJ741DRAFT_653222 [Chytriomyces cf. hyalinus JEL632]|nr:hypothetical protein BJ741DRAFT_653222 [Chytriomyces cf. hyalinus JEL632]